MLLGLASNDKSNNSSSISDLSNLKYLCAPTACIDIYMDIYTWHHCRGLAFQKNALGTTTGTQSNAAFPLNTTNTETSGLCSISVGLPLTINHNLYLLGNSITKFSLMLSFLIRLVINLFSTSWCHERWPSLLIMQRTLKTIKVTFFYHPLSCRSQSL